MNNRNKRNPEPKGIVTCTNCGEQTPLGALLGGDSCPACRQEITDDAPTKIRSELVDGKWDRIVDEDYSPMGGVQYSQDEISEPDRDIETLTERLTATEQGDVVQVTIGAAEFEATTRLYVLSHDQQTAGFDHRVYLVERPHENGWTRLYATGIGSPTLDPWGIASAPYDVGGDRTLDMRDFASNGWVIEVQG